MAETLSTRLTRFALDLAEETPTAELAQAVRRLLLDYLGNAIGGSISDSAHSAQRFLLAQALSGTAVALGAGSAPPQYAALVNGVAAHSLEMDDTHQSSSLHPGATTFSAALAAVDEQGAEPARFIPAVVAGYEVICRLGMALDPAAHYDRGFHPTATAGVFGAVVTAGTLLRLSEDDLINALGIAGSMSAGLMEFLADGSWTKRLHPGWAAHSGILAVQLARAGYTGPRTVFEGRHGFLAAYSPTPHPEALSAGLGSEFQILRTSIKAHACCRYKQAPIDGILSIVNKQGLKEGQVERVDIGVLSAGWEIIVEPDAQKRDPRSVVDAQFSMPYGAAVALLYGRASTAEYDPGTVASPEVRRAMTKIHCRRDASLDHEFPARWPASVQLTTKDGRRFSTRIDYPKGDPENPFSDDELEQKFCQLTAGVLEDGQQRSIIDAVNDLPAAGSPTSLVRALRAANEALSGEPGVRSGRR
jgi:2-methylcitrate dehydratase PrpD